MSFIEFDSLKITDAKTIELLSLAKQFAHNGSSLLIIGESGTGKSSLARYIHDQGRKLKPLEIIDSKYTDVSKVSDIFARAAEGTVIVEDIDLASISMQTEIYNAIEMQKENSQRPRIIATAKRELRSLARQEQFRQDLYYKITVVTLQIPRLAERLCDFNEICRAILDIEQIIHSKNAMSISAQAMEKLQAWPWPGNILELENVLERALILAKGSIIEPQNIIFESQYGQENPSDFGPGMSLSEVERRLILQTLELTSQNRTRAAQMLGISIRTLRNKLNEYREVGA